MPWKSLGGRIAGRSRAGGETPAERDEDREGGDVEKHRDIERGEDPERKIPVDQAIDKMHDQRRRRCTSAGQFALPEGEDAGAAGERLAGNDRHQGEVQQAEPGDADDAPAEPRTERDDDEESDVERDDDEVECQDRFGESNHGGTVGRGFGCGNSTWWFWARVRRG